MAPVKRILRPCYSGHKIEAGCDEAGRGCLAGPVFAAAVILPVDYHHTQLNDSKQLSECLRYRLREEIEKEAISWSVEHVLPAEIDLLNILRASITAMHRALNKLEVLPEFLLIDGNRFINYKNIPHQCIIKGDSRYCSIAAASILAKTYRDDYMKRIHKQYSCYGWDKNKGYSTSEHRLAIETHGISPHHRKSFRLTDSQLSLDFR
ncbi:MAG: ribonuclease HII [Bacteroidales bacterium]|nr:ribonuclease HII [Bacteroidales bacterium]